MKTLKKPNGWDVRRWIKEMYMAKTNKEKSDKYWGIMAELAGWTQADELIKKYNLYPPPHFVDMKFVNAMLKTCLE